MLALWKGSTFWCLTTSPKALLASWATLAELAALLAVIGQQDFLLKLLV